MSPGTTRYLCSHLVELFAGGKTQWVNLEEIWRGGALVECEEAVLAGAEVAILAAKVQFRGVVSRVDCGEFGWSVEVVFSDGVVWDVEKFRPEHLFDPRDLGPVAPGGSLASTAKAEAYLVLDNTI